jgi:anti-sigma factor RsiW
VKLSIDLDDFSSNNENNDSVAELLRNVIKDEVTAIVRSEVRRQMKSKEAEVKRMVADVANRDWRQLAAMLLELKEKP